MKNIFFCFFLISSPLHAEMLRYGTKEGVKTAEVQSVKIQDAFIKLSGSESSIAYRKLKQFKIASTKSLFHPRKNLAMLVCEEKFKGSIGLGINEQNNSVSFCLFNDESFIDINSLEFWLQEHEFEIVRKK